MAKKSNLQAIMDAAGQGAKFKPKVTRPHMALEYRERGQIGHEELVRSLFPHLAHRVLHPEPRRQDG